MLEVINPATGDIIARHPMHDADALRAATRAATVAFDDWRRTSFAERATVLRAAATGLRTRRGALAELMALEMGKPIAQGRSEVDKCAWVCEHYAEHGAALLADEPIAVESHETFTACLPLGPILAIMPWNFPLWQVFRATAPALMAGNVVLLKHAGNVPGCALAIAEIWEAAGAPAGTFQALLIDGAGARRLIRAAAVKAVTLTGSTAAGRAVAREAGARLKKSVLELGGSDPYLILEDADLELAVEACVTSRLINSGQSCIAAKRFIVVEPVRREFEERFVARMSEAVVGDPLDERTTVGPLARVDLRDELHDQVVRSQVKGARLVLGGRIPERRGAWYPVTVLTDVPRGAAAWREELFGPVAAIIPVRSERAAITAANATPFGLGAAVFTRDVARGRRIARDALDAGSCAVNTFVTSDPRVPFGGINDSGYGRELGRAGIREFVNLKSVVVAADSA